MEAIQTQSIDELISNFLAELRATDPNWIKASSNDTVTVWYKKDESTGVYRLKFVGRIPHSPKLVDEVMFISDLRMVWDTVIEQIVEVEKMGDSQLLHIKVKAPPGVTNRDFVHVRHKKILKEGSVVLDYSITSEKVPESTSYVRAHTYFSGGLMEESFVPDVKTKSLKPATLYSTITQVDLKGVIPKSIINLVSSYSTLEWFENLSKACDKHTQGKLIKKK